MVVPDNIVSTLTDLRFVQLGTSRPAHRRRPTMRQKRCETWSEVVGNLSDSDGGEERFRNLYSFGGFEKIARCGSGKCQSQKKGESMLLNPGRFSFAHKL